MNTDQIAEEAANKIEAAFHCDARDCTRFIAIIKAAIEEAIEEHQTEHDRLQGIIEKDTMMLLAEREKSRVLGHLVDGLRAAQASEPNRPSIEAINAADRCCNWLQSDDEPIEHDERMTCAKFIQAAIEGASRRVQRG